MRTPSTAPLPGLLSATPSSIRPGMKILLVEDDPKTSAYLHKGLAEQGFSVDAAADGDEGLHLAKTGEYDAIVLDIMLPRRDGISVLSELRRAGRQTPVIMLTARDQLHDKVRGLEAGADDYLVKPFSFTELLARVRALLRRGPARQPETLRIADLELDLIRRHAVRGGKRLDLTPKEFGLLSLLARHAGDVVTRTVIAEEVWDMNFDGDSNVVDVHVRRLRVKLDEPFEKKLIHTVRGSGYVLEDRG
ncbi:MAG: Transcriptional activator protein CzcR [Planctomycetes bacterium]|nr:Transcriptional activator protein CzcR [Planctomycetota bacterium]